MILYNDKNDALLVVKEDTNVFISAANSVGKEYSEYRLSGFYDYIREYSRENPTSQFFLDKYEEKDYERIAIIYPVLEPYGSKVRACIIDVGVNRYANAFPTAICWLADGRIKSDELITHRFPLSNAAEAFGFASENPDQTVKVIIYNEI